MYKNNFQILTLCALFSPQLFQWRRDNTGSVFGQITKGLISKRTNVPFYSIPCFFIRDRRI